MQLQRLLGIIYFELDRSNDSARLWDSLLNFTEGIPGKIKSTESNNLIALNSRLDAFLYLARIRGEPKGYRLDADLVEKACDCDVGILESIRTINSNTYEINEAFGLLARAYHERALIEKNNAPAKAPLWFQKSKEMIEKIQGGVGSHLAKIQEINLSELQTSSINTRKSSTSNGN